MMKVESVQCYRITVGALYALSLAVGGFISIVLHEPSIAWFTGAGIFAVGLITYAVLAYRADRTERALDNLLLNLTPIILPIYAVLSGMGVDFWLNVVLLSVMTGGAVSVHIVINDPELCEEFLLH